jgi:hypothetical protein
MAADFAAAMFQLPVLLGLLLLAALAFLGRKHPANPSSFLGVGPSRLAVGYLAAIAVTLAYSGISGAELTQQKVALGHYSAAEAKARWAGTTFYLFVLVTPFVVSVLTAVGLPVLAWLHRIRLASLVGAALAASLFSALIAGWVLVSPYNLWCSSHALACSTKAFASSAGLSIPVAVAFALGARLPWLRSPALQANNSSKPTPLSGAA